MTDAQTAARPHEAVEPDARGPHLRPAGGAGGQRQRHPGHLRRGCRRTGSPSGPSRPSGSRWDEPFTEVLDWSNPPFAKWFTGGKLNAAYNCVDRHVEAGNGDRVALHWVGEPADDTRTITYADLQAEVNRAANALDRARCAGRGPGRDLHADDPRDRRGHAGLRPRRRPAHRRLRRLLRRRPGLPGRGLRHEGHHHHRRRLPPRRRLRAQAGGRRGRRQGQHRRAEPGRARRRRTPDRAGRLVGRQPRQVVARAGRRPVRGARRASPSTPSTRST